MNYQFLNDIKEAALEFWIDYNYEVAQGRKEGEEWLDEEEEAYCFKDTTIETVETDICFCSVGGCVKPDFEEEDEECDKCGNESVLWCMSDGCRDLEEEEEE